MDMTTHRTSERSVAVGNVAGDSSRISVQKDVKRKIVISEEEKKEMALHMKKYMEENGITLKPAFGIPPGITYINTKNSLVRLRKDDREAHEEMFRNLYDYGLTAEGSTNHFTGTIEDRTCIWSGGIAPYMEKSSGIMWVGVHGLDSVCVVTRSGHVDWKRVHGGLEYTDPKTVLNFFRKCVISEIEDLADPSTERLKKIKQIIKKPFSVVCATLDTTETRKESGLEYYKKAIEFLKDEITSETSFTVDGTIQTAISAFQHLFKKRLDANEIEVSVTCDINVGIFDLEVSRIEEYVGVIDDPALPHSKKIKTSMVPVARSCPSCKKLLNEHNETWD